MKQEEKKILGDSGDKLTSLVNGFLNENGLSNLQLSGLIFKSNSVREDDLRDPALFELESFRCPSGFKKVIHFNNSTGEQIVTCEPI